MPREPSINPVKGKPVEITCPVVHNDEYDDAPAPLFVAQQVKVPKKFCRGVFDVFDRKDVGYFTHRDVRRVFKSEELIYIFVSRFDKDGDGQVTFEEFYSSMQTFVQQEGDLSLYERIYLTLSEPSSCQAAFYCSLTVMLLIVLSTISFILETVPDYRSSKYTSECCWDENSYLSKLYNATQIASRFPDEKCACPPEAQAVFAHIETACIIVFSLEFVIRAAACHALRFGDDLLLHLPVASTNVNAGVRGHTSSENLWNYFSNTLNLIDLAAILPFWVALLLDAAGMDADLGATGFLRVLRLARVFRVFKMGKYNKGMQLVMRVMIHSAPALKLLAFFTLLGMVLFGSMLYYCELGEWKITEEWPEGAYMRVDVRGLGEEATPFTSIPACFWWVIVTQTTVGYGDTYPTTDAGKIVGTFCMISGLLVLALPITIIGANFANEYAKSREQEAKEKAEESARALERAAREQAKRNEQAKANKNGPRSSEAWGNEKGSASFKEAPESPSKAESPSGMRDWLSKTVGSPIRSQKKTISPTKELEGKEEGPGESTPVQAAFMIEDDHDDHDDDHDEEAEAILARYQNSKVATMKLATSFTTHVRDLLDANLISKHPADSILKELEMSNILINEGGKLQPSVITRQLRLILLQIERCEQETTNLLPVETGNRLRQLYLEYASSMFGPVISGAPNPAHYH